MHAEPDLTRRQFHTWAARCAIGSAASLALPSSASEASARPVLDPGSLHHAPGDATPVAVAAVLRGAGAEAGERAVRAVAQTATDFAWLSRGDTVLLKPACNSGNPYPATTDPLALRAMIGLLRENGAGRILVADMSGVQFLRFSKDQLRGSTRALMHRAGMARQVEEAGAELHAFEEAGWDAFFEEAPEVEGSWSGPIRLPAVLREVDHVVLMPRCSRHLLAGSTLGLKAAVGWWRHDTRLEYHRDAATFAEKTADANTLPSLRAKQRLVLTSATRVLATFGPDDGYAADPETGLVFASTDVVAHDMLSLAWLVESRRRATPPQRLEGMFDDPNTSALFVNVANHIVVQMLGGLGPMFRTQRLARFDLDTLWDDRVLRRAFQVFGGVPRVEIADADGSLPSALRQQLVARVAIPT